MSETVVKIENLVKRYKELTAVDHFNLEIKEGEILGLLGPNGSGKTTTLNCLLSLLDFDEGTIEVFGQKMNPDSYSLKRNIGVILQNVALFDTLTVYENIDFFCGLYIKEKAARRKCVEEAIQFVELSEFQKFYPKKLSGGLLRRLNIACGIAHKPKLIILDEPTVAVDPQSRNKILEGIVELNKQGTTIIYTSHYMEEVEAICSRIVIMDKGKNIANGTANELKTMTKNNETIFIDMRVLPEEDLLNISKLNHVAEASYTNEVLMVKCNGGKHNLIHIMNYLQEKGITFGRVHSELPTLNDVFLEITGKELRD
ncbi:ABC transporter ATP-binding protein [Anaerocolumna sp. AGMB13025]|uniref:ABC transporter ATP-binding protein n=1 Tax=Anaerocolumna sp. AGMB13025 TaxID=3039116 RepID=UPI00241F79E0|nr:ABC transporter ATP-binding protein [Anaerocolumna sp. AGMB13025]WFR57740.1 ABC transporter ATP-binding protein [Anaerocolumna sp. AGMB13025]